MKQVRKETKNGKVLVLKPWKRKQNRENERHFQYFCFQNYTLAAEAAARPLLEPLNP